MSRATPANTQREGPSLFDLFGATALQGSTADERRALEIGYTLTLILTGDNVCLSLTDTAKMGGC